MERRRRASRAVAERRPPWLLLASGGASDGGVTSGSWNDQGGGQTEGPTGGVHDMAEYASYQSRGMHASREPTSNYARARSSLVARTLVWLVRSLARCGPPPTPCTTDVLCMYCRGRRWLRVGAAFFGSCEEFPNDVQQRLVTENSLSEKCSLSESRKVLAF